MRSFLSVGLQVNLLCNLYFIFLFISLRHLSCCVGGVGCGCLVMTATASAAPATPAPMEAELLLLLVLPPAPPRL